MLKAVSTVDCADRNNPEIISHPNTDDDGEEPIVQFDNSINEEVNEPPLRRSERLKLIPEMLQELFI